MAEQVTQANAEVGYNDDASQHLLRVPQANIEVAYNDDDVVHILRVFQTIVEVGHLYVPSHMYWQVW